MGFAAWVKPPMAAGRGEHRDYVHKCKPEANLSSFGVYQFFFQGTEDIGMTFWHGFGRMIPRSLDRGSLLNNQRRAQIHLPRFSARASKSALQRISVTRIV